MHVCVRVCASVCVCLRDKEKGNLCVYVLLECVFKMPAVCVSCPGQFTEQVLKMKLCLQHLPRNSPT